LNWPEPASGRIKREHRLDYKVEKGELIVLACRYHYRRRHH